MRTLYIHIGNLKTGTTAIQEFCNNSRGLLKKHGYCYPRSEGGYQASHHRLALALHAEHKGTVPIWYKDNVSFSQCMKEYLAEIEQSDRQHVILSCEAFSRLFNLNDPLVAIQQLVDGFSGFHIKVICYIREPLSMARSLYNQSLKEDRVAAMKMFTDWFYALDKNILLLHETLPWWGSVIGSENVIVRPYIKNGTEHINDFLNSVGLPNLCDGKKSNEVINQKVDDDELERKRVGEVFEFVPQTEWGSYLSSLVLTDRCKWNSLHRIIDNINKSYSEFHLKHFPDIEYQPFGVFDIISHNERITRLVEPVKRCKEG